MGSSPPTQSTFSQLPPSPACFSGALLLGRSKYPPLVTCPLKKLGHFGRIFLPYAHFPFLPSTLALTRISPSPLRRCCSHVVPIFLQENPLNPSRQLRVRLVLEQLRWIGQRAGLPQAPPVPMAHWRHLPSFQGRASPAPATPAGNHP